MGGAANLKVDIGTSLATLGGIVPVIAVGMATIGLAKQSITVLNDVLGRKFYDRYLYNWRYYRP